MKTLKLLIFVILFSFNDTLAQPKDAYCLQAAMLMKMLEKYHYQPVEINDRFSGQTYQRFLKMLDPYCLFFTDKDINTLSVYRLQLDDEINNRSCDFLHQVIYLYRQRLIQAETHIEDILQKPFDFSLQDSIYFTNRKGMDCAADENILMKRWHKWLKYKTLVSLFYSDEDINKSFTKELKLILSKESETRNKVNIKSKRNIKRILDHPMGYENYVASLYFNVLATGFDPHTTYLSSTVLKNFVSSLSSEVYSFGMDFEENLSGNVQISHLVPGGPAWRSNQLHKGDVLIKIKWPGSQTIDLSFADFYEVKNILQSSGSDRLELTVRKINGQVKTVSLLKEKMRAEENVIKSFLLKGDKTIGYISLPGFYTEWENQSALGCANDMAKEIIKLQKEKINGIILDLRFNTGGSMNEALKLAGIFIDSGPLSIVRYKKDGKPFLLKDMNRGTIYDGPLALMVNGMTASASELLAAALQDYNRALIVGSKTFGKATAQVILPLDTAGDISFFNLAQANNELAFVKVTTSKYYRLTKNSHQQTGVIPDIILPGLFTAYEYREATDPLALPSDSVNKKVYYIPLSSLPIEQLADKNAERISKNEKFSQINSINDVLSNSLKQETAVSLELKSYLQQINKAGKSMESLTFPETSLFNAVNNKYDQEINRIDEYRREINDILLKNILKDPYIEEAYLIITDYINLLEN